MAEETLLHRQNHSHRVVRAAPHPAGGELNPKEYYMTDPPNVADSRFIVNPGKTHEVFYAASFEKDARVECHALESWGQIERFVTESFRSGTDIAGTPEGLVAKLREKADKLEQWLEKNPQPAEAEFQGMPYAGMKVWVEHPGKPGTLVNVAVTEIFVSDGQVCVATEGWKYFRPGCWFWTEEEAKASLQKT